MFRIVRGFSSKARLSVTAGLGQGRSSDCDCSSESSKARLSVTAGLGDGVVDRWVASLKFQSSPERYGRSGQTPRPTPEWTPEFQSSPERYGWSGDHLTGVPIDHDAFQSSPERYGWSGKF